MQSTTKGYIYAFITVVLWSGWSVVTRLGAVNGLSPMDITFMRYTFAGLVMLPVSYKNRHLITKKNLPRIVLMIIGAGPPYLLAMGFGFKLAPASHGILTPCVMSLFVALFSYMLFKDKITKIRAIGYSLIITGVAFKFTLSLDEVSASHVSADLFFLLGAALWAVYSVQNRIAGFNAFVATAFVATGSLIAISVPYGIYQYIEPHNMRISDSLLQLFYQGIVTSIISLITYNKAMQYIGTGKTAAFGALVPAMVTLLATPLLGEIPSFNDYIFVALMSGGVLLASGIVKKSLTTTLKNC